MNRRASHYVEDLVMTGAQAVDDALARRAFDMAEGALAVLLLDERITPAVHQAQAAALANTRRIRFGGL